MGNRLMIFATALVFGSLILFTSVLRITSVKYAFSQSPGPTPDSHIEDIFVDYKLPDPSLVPGDLMWPVQATLDKLNYYSIAESLSKSEFLLNLADERLSAGYSMIVQEDFDDGVPVLTRAEQYLAKSYDMAKTAQNEQRYDALLLRLARASLKHRELLEKSLLVAPEDAKPVIVKILDPAKDIYNQTSAALYNFDVTPPANPF
jgi:hypothetical protein